MNEEKRLELEELIVKLNEKKEESISTRGVSLKELNAKIDDCYRELEGVAVAEVDESISFIQHKTAKLYGVTVTAMKEKTRKRKIVEARQVVMRMINKKHPSKTLASIGNIFGKDHATVLHAKRVINERIETHQLLVELPESWI